MRVRRGGRGPGPARPPAIRSSSRRSAPGIDRGVRDNDVAARAAHGARRPRPAVHARRRALPARQRHREVPRRHGADGAPRDARARQRRDDAGGPLRRLRHRHHRCRPPIPRRRRAQLDAQPDVEYAQARYRVRPMFTPNDPLYSRQWNYPAIDMERAWDINPGATSVDHRRRARQRRRVPQRRGPLQRARRCGSSSGPIFPALGADRRAVRGGARPRRRRSLRLAARLHLGRRRSRSTSTATARTSPAPSASSRTTASASPAWRSTSASCRSR